MYSKVVVTVLLTGKVLPFQKIKTPTPGVQSVFCQETLQYVVEVNGDSGDKALRVFNPYPTAFPYGNGMVLHFYQQQESSTTKTVHKVINKGLKTYV